MNIFKQRFLNRATKILSKKTALEPRRKFILDNGGIVRHLDKGGKPMFLQFKANGKIYIDFNLNIKQVKENQKNLTIGNITINDLKETVEYKGKK